MCKPYRFDSFGPRWVREADETNQLQVRFGFRGTYCNRQDSEDILQDAFLRLWERWDRIDRIEDPTAYLFRVALNGFRMTRRRAGMAMRKVVRAEPEPDAFSQADMRADVRRLLLGLTPRQRAALLLVDLFGYPSEQAARILLIRPST